MPAFIPIIVSTIFANDSKQQVTLIEGGMVSAASSVGATVSSLNYYWIEK